MLPDLAVAARIVKRHLATTGLTLALAFPLQLDPRAPFLKEGERILIFTCSFFRSLSPTKDGVANDSFLLIVHLSLELNVAVFGYSINVAFVLMIFLTFFIGLYLPLQ